MTSIRGKRAVENIDDVYDRNDPPIQKMTETHPKDRRNNCPPFTKPRLVAAITRVRKPSPN